MKSTNSNVTANVTINDCDKDVPLFQGEFNYEALKIVSKNK